MSFVGGVPGDISAGAAGLRGVAQAVDVVPAQVSGRTADAAAAGGHPALAAAAERLGASWSHRLQALAVELYAAGHLARNAAADLETAGGRPG